MVATLWQPFGCVKVRALARNSAGPDAARAGCEDRQVVPESIRDFFVAGASASGALIGLLFVAISVAAERLAREDARSQFHRVRAAAALTAFINALTVSLFALIPGHKIGITAVVTATVGLVFVVAALLSLIRRRQVRQGTRRDILFLTGLVVTFLIQLAQGIDVITQPADAGAVNTIGVLVVVCFLIGIARAWELIGGPSIGLTSEVIALFKDHSHNVDQSAAGEPPAAKPPADN
jgi:hypothetical protein